MDCEHIRECICSIKDTREKYEHCGKTDCLRSCDERTILVAEENGKRYELHNHGDTVAAYRVDGAMLTSPDSVKCDMMMVDITLLKAILIELKGRDLRHGLEQLGVTLDRMREALSGYSIYGRIVTSHRTNVPNIKTDPQYIRLQKKFALHQGNIKTAVGCMREAVAEM